MSESTAEVLEPLAEAPRLWPRSQRSLSRRLLSRRAETSCCGAGGSRRVREPPAAEAEAVPPSPRSPPEAAEEQPAVQASEPESVTEEAAGSRKHRARAGAGGSRGEPAAEPARRRRIPAQD